MTLFDFTLRPVIEDDLQLLFEWRNRLEVRAYMYTYSEIPLSDHCKWFASMLVDPARQFLVLSMKGVECAVVAYTNIEEGESSSWGFYTGPNAPAGVSLIVELAGLSYAFETLGLRRLHCEVLSGNQQVINLHTKAGFTREGCLRQARQTMRGLEDVIIFGMLDDEWPPAQTRLYARAERFFELSRKK